MATYLREFGDICSWVNYAENNHEHTQPDSLRHSKMVNNPRWNGVHSFEEAFDTLRKGWPEGLARMRKVLDCVRNIVKIETPVYVFHDDIEGMAPNVENYIQGIPEDMFAMEQIRMDAPPTFIQVQVEMAVSCFITSDQFTWAGAVLFAAIEGMRIQGCCAELLLSFSSQGNWGDLWMCSVPVPNTLDMDTLAYLFTHPACGRTICIAAMEHEAPDIRQKLGISMGGGHGRPSLVKSSKADVYLRGQHMCQKFGTNWDQNVKIAQAMLNKLVDTKFQSFE